MDRAGKKMKKYNKIWQKDGYTLRLAKKEDVNEYYEHNFNPLDAESVRLTGGKSSFSKEEVTEFFLKCVDAEERYDFMIVAPDGHIIGESVLNEMDEELRSANFRILLFHSVQYGKGIGSWAVEKTVEFAFEELGLHRLELDVFSFNPRAIRVYEKAGFKVEGVRRDAVKNGNEYGDDILMAILEDEWKTKIKTAPGKILKTL